VLSDEDLLRGPGPEPRVRGSNRGFWLVIVTLLTLCAVVVVAIFANRPLVTAIARSESELRYAQALADDRFAEGGTYLDADAASLAAVDDGVAYVAGDVASPSLGTVSVYATATVWAAAVQARPGACFYIARSAGGRVRYGSGTTCTGLAATAARSDAW
jgi:hypothetical protein